MRRSWWEQRMETKAILVDIGSCYGCMACEVACKQEHNLDVGTHFIKVHEAGPWRIGGKLVMDYVPMTCRHCGRPACVEACPEKAIFKRSDGIVLIREEKCTGCRVCMEACPFGALRFLAGKNIVQKCDLCVQRVDQGRLPSCVHHCPTQALTFGDPNQFSAQLQKRRAEKIAQERRS